MLGPIAPKFTDEQPSRLSELHNAALFVRQKSSSLRVRQTVVVSVTLDRHIIVQASWVRATHTHVLIVEPSVVIDSARFGIDKGRKMVPTPRLDWNSVRVFQPVLGEAVLQNRVYDIECRHSATTCGT
jgi:hypothetical protein